MSFLLILNDFGFIFPFTVSSTCLVLPFQCLIHGHCRCTGTEPKHSETCLKRTPEVEVLMRGDTSKCTFSSCFCLQDFCPSLQQLRLAPYLNTIFHRELVDYRGQAGTFTLLILVLKQIRKCFELQVLPFDD